MLHPSQFEVNEAWIAFRLNQAPIKTEVDGDLNCIALMDAASCYLLGMELVSGSAEDLTQAQCRRLLESARKHKQELPTTLLVPQEDNPVELIAEAAHNDIDVVRVPENNLLAIIGEAREGFAERFGGGRSDA
jgi:hypothetical protein